MKTQLKTGRGRIALAAAVVGLLATTACSASSGASSGNDPLSVVGYSVLEAANKPVFEDFEDTDAGKDVTFKTSYGASGDQSRAVAGGLDADYVHFSLETDVTRLVDAGLVGKDWKDGPTKGIVTSSVVVFVVREGNPKNIRTWDDLVEPGVEIITPNPGSSGSARWNILAGYGHVTADGGTEEEATEYTRKLLENTIALPGSGREATTAFTSGNGDVLLSYENEAILARQNGEAVDYIIPPETLLIENPGAVTTDAQPAAQSFLDFLLGPVAQEEYAKSGFRPVIDGVATEVEGANDPADPFPTPGTLLTIDDDFGGWADAATKFFADGEDGGALGIIPQLQQDTGKTA
ncbi:sulfate ABC transporter substrate-binding protein [Nocardioides sp. LHG3406-4]|uniref:sulfate ABC transporter substrate-binding protein n=1 Tax=Nocardioides sp. LHG3406-4 TaxID=2804575 RepID=UPI003CF6BCF3